MANRLEIEIRLLKKDEEDLRKQIDIIENSIDGTYTASAELSRMWEGSAKAAFVNSLTQDQEDMKELCKDLKKFLRCMEKAVKEYERAEQRVQEIVSSIIV